MKIDRTVSAIAAFLLILVYGINAQIIIPQTPLKYGRDGNIIISSLVDGDSLFQKIAQIAKKNAVSSGLVLFSIGQLRDFSIGQYNSESKRFVSKTYTLPWEVISLQGTISYGIYSIGGLQINVKATLADSTNGTIAGHLTKGIVAMYNEIVVLKLKEINLFRRYNPQSGYWELDMLIPN